MTDLHNDLKSLGSSATAYTYDSPQFALLECFPAPMKEDARSLGFRQQVHITSSEFTSLCPKTGQPDFATIVIDYEPDLWCVESKSLKLYFGSFRMHGEFHEACVARIARDLVDLLNPHALRVVGQFTARGGIPFWPTVEYTRPTQPKGVPADDDLDFL